MPSTKKRRVPEPSRVTAMWCQAPRLAVTPEHWIEKLLAWKYAN